MQPPAPIPIDILTGFLGAGKTTLLNALVKDAALADAVVLINEFGEIGLDHLLVEGVQGDMLMLSSGCLCCSIRGELVSALEDLLRRLDNGRIRRFDRVVIETTGLADPAPILNTLMLHPYLARRFGVAAVVTVVDAVNGAATLDAHEEARRQAAVADRLVLTKTDLAGAAQVKALKARLARLNPTALLLYTADRPDAGLLLDTGLYDPAGKTPDVARWLNAEALAAREDGPGHGYATDSRDHDDAQDHDAQDHDAHGAHVHDVNRHDERIRAFSLTSAAPLPAASLDLFLQFLRAIDAGKLLRMKGIVALAERPDEPLVLHGVQHVMHEPVRLPGWPSADRTSRLVLIAQDMPERRLRELWAAITDTPAVDAADREALAHNPLKPTLSGLLG